MESVKNLVVGEHRCLLKVIYKAFMQGSGHRNEIYVVAAVCKNRPKAVKLFFAVTQNIQGVVFLEQTGKRLTYKVEVLVIYCLGRTLEVDGQ